MRDYRLHVGALAVTLACLGPATAESDQVVATIDRPAVLTAVPAAGQPRPADMPARVVVKVTGYQPPLDGAVQAVVKVEGAGGGTEQVIGRFAVFPTTAFNATDPSRAQTYGVPLPKELTNRDAVKLSVHLEPIRGSGKGASLEIGSAEIR